MRPKKSSNQDVLHNETYLIILKVFALYSYANSSFWDTCSHRSNVIAFETRKVSPRTLWVLLQIRRLANVCFFWCYWLLFKLSDSAWQVCISSTQNHISHLKYSSFKYRCCSKKQQAENPWSLKDTPPPRLWVNTAFLHEAERQHFSHISPFS